MWPFNINLEVKADIRLTLEDPQAAARHAEVVASLAETRSLLESIMSAQADEFAAIDARFDELTNTLGADVTRISSEIDAVLAQLAGGLSADETVAALNSAQANVAALADVGARLTSIHAITAPPA